MPLVKFRAARCKLEELGEQVEAYERLQTEHSRVVVLEGVEDLPNALIRARIAAGMTQESLGHRLGLSVPKPVRLVRNG